MKFEIYFMRDIAGERTVKITGVGLSLVTAKRSLVATVGHEGVSVESHKSSEPQDDYRHQSHMPLGFGGGEVQPGATVMFTTTTQVMFKPERLVIVSGQIGLLEVSDVRIGKRSQFAAAAGVPAAMFANGQAFKCETALVGQEVSVTVSNKSEDIPARVGLAMMGLGVW